MANAQPTEWLLSQGALGTPYAIVRHFAFGDVNRPDVWFRVVTWAPRSEERELIGWCRTLEAASAVAWDPKARSFLVGHAARQRRGTADPPVESIKRKMGQERRVKIGEQELSPPEVSAKILAELSGRMRSELAR